MTGIKKIIIWGHKLHSHTHSYIHNAFYNSFKKLNYDTYWFDDNDDVSNFDFSNSFFITEHQVNKKIPCRTDCLYLSHYIDEGDYIGVPKENIIMLKISKRDFFECDIHHNYQYKELNYGEKWEYYSNIDGYNCLYMYWATDIFPEQINENIKKLGTLTRTNKINFIGTFGTIWRKFYELCNKYNLIFQQYGATFNINSNQNMSILQNQELIQTSFTAPALQDDHQIKCKYIPCRIFKNISYGKMGITNNPTVNELFDNRLIYDNDLNALFQKIIQFELTPDYEKMKELMEYVRDHHTYLNRINTIKCFIKDYTSFIL
jgi:hypothetical protein